jgi:NAD(P)-dependent dehydrogenase (short-subunit alcohol dehydrogenase family)
MRLDGKTALVTAAGQGIGRASALALAAEGAQVWATDVNASLLVAYEGVAGVRAVALDVLDKGAIERLISSLPALDVLFNCAGFVHSGTALQATDEEWNFALNLNVRSQFWAIQAALPKMLAAGRGSIINMASVCGSIKGLPNRFIYGTTKAAVIGLTKSVAATSSRTASAATRRPRTGYATPRLHQRYADPAQRDNLTRASRWGARRRTRSRRWSLRPAMNRLRHWPGVWSTGHHDKNQLDFQGRTRS